MKIKLLLLAVLVAALGMPASADARKLTSADKALAKKLTAHLGAMGEIMDKHAKDTNKTLDKLERYVGKNKSSIAKVLTALEKISNELDADEKDKLEAFVKDDADMKKFMTAVMAFGMSLGSNQTAAERFGNIMKSLAPDSGGDKKADKKKAATKKKAAAKKKKKSAK